MGQTIIKHPIKRLELALQGGRECVCIGKDVIRILGEPTHITLAVSEGYDSIAVCPCDEDDVMSFMVPKKLLVDHHCVFRITSKQFVRDIMKANGLDISKSYPFFGEYSESNNSVKFIFRKENDGQVIV